MNNLKAINAGEFSPTVEMDFEMNNGPAAGQASFPLLLELPVNRDFPYHKVYLAAFWTTVATVTQHVKGKFICSLNRRKLVEMPIALHLPAFTSYANVAGYISWPVALAQPGNAGSDGIFWNVATTNLQVPPRHFIGNFDNFSFQTEAEVSSSNVTWFFMARSSNQPWFV